MWDLKRSFKKVVANLVCDNGVVEISSMHAFNLIRLDHVAEKLLVHCIVCYTMNQIYM